MKRLSSSQPLLLIMDSDEVARDLYSRWFFSEGFGVMCAGGREGLRYVLRREAPALIVSELQVRDLSISDLVKRLDSSELTRLIPVLVLTAQPHLMNALSRADRERLAILPKYCDFGLLGQWVRQLTYSTL
jgi:CheY-like chemotaxis protein